LPNFLSAALGVGNSIRTSGASGLFNPSGFNGASTAGLTTAFSTGSLSAGVGAALAPLGLGGLGLAGVLGGGVGTKPKALHTEYAKEEANWEKPYGMGTDIVFYLQRADQTSSISDTNNNFGGDLSKGDQGNFNSQADSLTTTALPTNVGGVEQSRIPSNVQAGPNDFLPGAPSLLNQVGAASKVGTLRLPPQAYRPNSSAVTGAGAFPTKLGFLTNFDRNLAILSGTVFTGTGATVGSAGQNAASATGAAVAQQRFTPNYPTGAKYWSDLTNNAFNPEGTSPFEVPTAEFGEELSLASGGINSSEFLTESVKSGGTAFTPPSGNGSTALDFGSAIQGGLEVGPTGTLSGSDDIPSEWYFITAPGEVSWSKDSEAKSLSTYGSNNPYLSYGTTKLRKLTLGSCLVEGFSNGKAVEDNILQLEKCMKMVLNAGSGYTSPYCWRVFAGGKSYGVFLITSVKFKEAMRDLSGHATRAIVDIEFQEVPAYQVSSGIDLTNKAIVGKVSDAYNAYSKERIRNQQKAGGKQAAGQDSKVAGASSGTGGGNGSGENESTGANNRTQAADPGEFISFSEGGF